MRRVLLGIELRDWPTCIWMRLTYCRQQGHLFAFNDRDYCAHCGGPWLFLPLNDFPRRGPSAYEDES